MLFCMPTFNCMASIFSCMIQLLNFSHMAQSSIKRLACAQPIRGRAHTRPDQTVHHEQPSRALVRAMRHEPPRRAPKTCTQSWVRPKRALGHAYARIHTQSCPSHLEHSVLHTLKYEQCLLLLLIYLWAHCWPNHVGYLTVFVFLPFLFKLHTYLT